MSGNPPIQIVDDKDKVIGEMDIVEAYRRGKTHRIARVMIEDPAGNILLQMRASGLKRWPNCWDNSAAGHVDAGEDYLTAAARELEEEIGLKKVDLEELGTYFSQFKKNGQNVKRFNRVYKAVVSRDTPIIPNPEEVSKVRWFSLEELREFMAYHPDKCTDGITDTIARFYS